jgi:hypothetical protein
MTRQWRPPGPNDTELSTVQSYFTLPEGQRGRSPYFELSNVRLQNRTIWVYTGELPWLLCLPASLAPQSVFASWDAKHVWYEPHSCLRHLFMRKRREQAHCTLSCP